MKSMKPLKLHQFTPTLRFGHGNPVPIYSITRTLPKGSRWFWKSNSHFSVQFPPLCLFPLSFLLAGDEDEAGEDFSGQIWQHFNIYLELHNIYQFVGSCHQDTLAAHTRIKLFCYVGKQDLHFTSSFQMCFRVSATQLLCCWVFFSPNTRHGRLWHFGG